MFRSICVLLLLISWALPILGQNSAETVESLPELVPSQEIRRKFGPARLNFSASVDGLRSYWSVMSFNTLPEEKLSIRISDAPEGSIFQAEFDGEKVDSLAHNYWQLRAPKKHGIYSFQITELNSKEQMQLNIVVLHPWNGKDSALNGYKIGYYQSALYKGLKTYTKPKGFIEVTRENQDTWVSPHFQLKQFACRQTKTGSIHPDQNPINTFPKYMLLETRLLIKLELLIQRFDEKGIKTDGMYVHSAYRTPFYNKMIGNKTVYSRHCYGDAADIFIDTDKDKMMDDLDKDGKTGDDDADIMFQTAHEVLTKPWHEPLVGGVGYYRNRSYRGPFIHVDTRGYEIHWGKDKPRVPQIAGLEELTKKLTKNQLVITESNAFYQKARKVELKADREAKLLLAAIAQKTQQAQSTDAIAAKSKTLKIRPLEIENLEALPLLASAEQELVQESVAVAAVEAKTSIAVVPKQSFWSKVKQFFADLF